MLQKIFAFLKNNSERSLALLLGVVILSLGMVFITLAWTEPSSRPPDGDDVAAPINVSGTGQAKVGKLGIQTDLSGTGYDSSYALSVGDTGGTDDGIKISGPLRLDPNDSNNNITGVNKITVNQVDPVYKIGNKKYVTYMADFVGLNAEVVGEGKLEDGKKVFNLAEQPRGSDLWLFWNIVKKDSIKPFVTAQGPADLYAKVKNGILMIESVEDNKETKFSYRLIGTRVDYDDESNLHPNQNIKNYINANQ